MSAYCTRIFGRGRRKRYRLRRTESASSAGGERRGRPRGQSFCGRRDCADAAQDYAGRKGGARNGGETFPANAPRATADTASRTARQIEIHHKKSARFGGGSVGSGGSVAATAFTFSY